MIDEYEIKAYTKFSWGYVYTQNGRRNEIWADSAESLKRKVSAKNLLGMTLKSQRPSRSR